MIREEPGGPEQAFRTYDPTPWTGVRLPHAWTDDGRSVQDLAGSGYTVLDLGGRREDTSRLKAAFAARGVPCSSVTLADDRLRDLYGRDLFLLRPDLHIAWRGNFLPDADVLARKVTGNGCRAKL